MGRNISKTGHSVIENIPRILLSCIVYTKYAIDHDITNIM